jgi:glycosyltransferase involved in cell wall biosynthesis
MLNPYWTRPRWLYRFLSRQAVATIVTNEHFASEVRRGGGRSLVIPDIPTSYPVEQPFAVDGAFNIMVVNTFSSDEPLGEILAAAKGLGDVVFYVSGDTRYADRQMLARVPANVRFTGFLPRDSYYSLMKSSQAVMCLTTRNHTMQGGAGEALSMGKPIVTSKWPLLEEYFCKGTVHVDNSAAGVREGVREMVRNHARYAAEITELQGEKHRTWQAGVKSLIALLDQLHFEGTPRSERAKIG